MDAFGLSEAEAFARLQRAARNRNERLPAIAQELIDQRDLLHGPHNQDRGEP